jgi:iron complex transport system ATP-binding protein
VALLDARIPSFSYGGPPILQGIEVRADRPGLLALLGPNGSGKSTLLKILAGLLPAPGATLHIHDRTILGRPAREVASLVSWVPQRPEIAEGLTVREMVRVGRYRIERPLRPLPPAEEALIQSALDEAALAPLAERDACTLSGGEAQRALLARALAQKAPVLLLDEPIASLDLRFQEETYARLQGLAQAGRLVLVADHHVELVADYADRLLLLSAGRIVADGPPSEVLTVQNLREVFGIERVLFADPVSGSPRLARPERSRPFAGMP